MNISFTQSELNAALQTVQRTISSKSILPILSGILLNIEKDYIDFYTTDLELSTKYRIAADSKEERVSVVLPARLIVDIVKNLPEAKINLDIDDKRGNVKLSCGSSSFDLKTYPAEDFPIFPELHLEKTISIEGKKLSSAIKQVIKAVSKDETRPVLCGILMTVNKGKLSLVTTDSYRLAIHEAAIENDAGGDINVIIPARCMDELSKICGDGDVEVGLTKNQIYFNLGNVVIVSRLIEGNFPNYQQLLPNSYELRAKLNKNMMVSALKRVSLLANNNALVKIKINKTNIQISASAAEVGSADEDIDAEVSGQAMEIAFNAQYLIDGLNSVAEDEVFIELNNPLKPGIIRPAEAQDFLYLAMPVRIG